jgi:beta-lactamase superfamily II metal-dependent hydrolase
MATYRYAGYPSAKVHEEKGGKKQIKHLLWGDWVEVKGEEEDGWVPVHVRSEDGWMKTEDLQEERLLEIVFVDVGQGDGCLVVTPKDEHILIDAGIGDNMYRFLKWRYAGFKTEWTFNAGIMTHPDSDHYAGFSPVIEDKNVRFKTLYHNGIMERRKGPALGATEKVGENSYLVELAPDLKALKKFLKNKEAWQVPDKPSTAKKYPLLLSKAVKKADDIRMLSVRHSENGFVPGFGEGKEFRIKVLGPIDEPDANGNARLRRFRDFVDQGSYDNGKTKNGHSIILQIQYRDINILLGGDLNTSAEMFLMEKYTGIKSPPETFDDAMTMVDAAQHVFSSEIAKSCHHGSADFTDLFIEAVQPVATVISSGDNESHAHPRSDTLGAIGMHSRGWRPLIFSTELARSTREKENEDDVIKLGRLKEKLINTEDKEKLAKFEAEHDALVAELAKRNVTSYGAINVRTDGNRAVLAYMLEKERHGRGGTLTRWDIYKLEQDEDGEFDYVE